MRIIPSRKTDPETSHQGEQDVAFRANTQKHKLLEAYCGPWALTADEAARMAGLNMRSCYWKRCSELREMGFIRDTGDTRMGESGSFQRVCRITDKGHDYLRELMD